jgi:glycosyltransferase involved in cell wall biosynthesis
MKVVQVVAGLESSDGGPSHTLPYLWSHLSRKGVAVSAFTTGLSQNTPIALFSDYSFKSALRNRPFMFKRSSELSKCLNHFIPETDICHDHGCWLYPNWLIGSLARKFRKPLVVSPLGHLDEWSLSHHSWRKAVLLKIIESKYLQYASLFIAKSTYEAEQIQKLRYKGNIAIIPNGLESTEWETKVSPSLFLNAYPNLKSKRVVLFLSRIHPKKGVMELVRLWARIGKDFKDWHLVIVGDLNTSYGTQVQNCCTASNIQNLTFITPLYSELKKSAFNAAQLFILPSFSENFGQVILEALASGLPVITTKGCPWPGLIQNQCGWWPEPVEKEIQRALFDALNQSESTLRKMGESGRTWVLKDYNWRNIAEQMCLQYKQLLS